MIELVIDQRRRKIGTLEVGRVLPYSRRRMIGPFIYFDHLGPVDFEPGVPRSCDILPHPHIGLSAVTWLFAGELVHRDSVGSQQPIHPGEVNWMTAGRGITHSERLERARAQGGPLHGIQAWVALPGPDEEMAPAFWHYGADEIPVVRDGGMQVRVIAGSAFGATSPVRIHSPMFLIHAELAAGARLAVTPEHPDRAAYVASGSVAIEGRPCTAGELVVFAPGDTPTLRASTDATVMLLGGEPVGPRYIEWNFVSSSRERIAQAKADWSAGRTKLPDFDHDEFMPLPPGPSAMAVSGRP